MMKKFLLPLSLLFLLWWAPGCSQIDLGDAPFFCNKGTPKCPDGYECVDYVCLWEDREVLDQGLSPQDTGQVKPGDTIARPDRNPKIAWGKFCNSLEKTGGIKFTMELKFSTLTMTALSGTCSKCRSLPIGTKISMTLWTQGETTSEGTYTLDIEKGKEYIFYSDLDATKVVLKGGPLKPEYDCATVDIFKP